MYYKGGMIIKNCIQCKKEFKVFYGRKDKAKFCSKKCHSKFGFTKEARKNMSKAQKGKKLSQIVRNKISKNNAKYWLNKKRENMRGINNSNYNINKHIVHYCRNLKCNNIISYDNWRNRKGLCCKCSCKNRPKYIMKKSTRLKMSLARKGKIPKNLLYIINKNESPREQSLFKMVKKYFKNVKRNYFVKTYRTKRFLDVAVPKFRLDFEYNGKMHLMKANIIRDKQRTKELKKLKWKIINIDRNNFNKMEKIIQKIVDKIKGGVK